MRNTLLLVVALFLISGCKQEPKTPANTAGMTGAQHLHPELNRFDKEINKFIESDKVEKPESGQILFVGSSSIRMWDSLAVDMAPLKVINRGFGGSTLPEVVHFADQIIFPYEPSTIVLYCGENDIAEGASPLKVFRTFKSLFRMIRKKMPETKIYFIPMKPSIARWNLWPDYQKGNQLISKFIASQENLEYLDLTTTMLTENGQIDSTIFIEDGLHMNRKGYEGWRDATRKVLIKEVVDQ